MSLIIRDTHDPGHNKLDLGVTVDEAVSFIVETLEDPLKPRWCGPCITACMVVIQLHHDTAEAVINKNHILGSTIAVFLTAKRSIADIEALASCWSKCRCSIAEISSHRSAGQLHYIVVGMVPVLAKISANYRAIGRFGDTVDVLGAVVENFARFFMDAVRKAKPFSVAKGRHPEIWPATPTDLIPYGPETTVESLVTWSRFTRSAHVFSLVCFFVRVCGPLIVPAIVASKSAPKYMVEHGLQICADISNASLDPNGQIDDLSVGVFLDELIYLGAYVHSLLTFPPLLFRDLHFGIANSTFDFATQALSAIESSTIPQSYRPQLTNLTNELATYAAMLWTIAPEQMTVPKARIHPAIGSIMDDMATPSPPAEFACSMMRHAKSIQFCFASGCPESAQSSGRVYMRCSGCRVVAYCGKDCQRRAWADKEHPHGGICKKMKQVYDVGGNYIHRDEDQDKFVREMRRAKIRDVVLKEIGIWLCEAYTKLQRKGPFMTPDARKYLSQKEGPRFTEGADEFMSQLRLSFMSNPKRRRGRGSG